MENGLNGKKDTIVMMDNNLDSLFNSSHNQTYNLKPLTSELNEFLLSNTLVVYNNKITHYSSFYPNSCIDHIYSNCSNKISNCITNMTGASDHAFLSVIYSSNPIVSHPKFINI